MWIQRTWRRYFNGCRGFPWTAGSGAAPYWFFPHVRHKATSAPLSLFLVLGMRPPHSSVRGAAPPLLQVLAQTVSSLQACHHFMKNPNSLFPVHPALLRPISPPLTQHLPCILLHYLGNCHHHLPRPPERRFSAERDRGHLGSFNPGPRAVLSVVHNTKQKVFSDGTTFLWENQVTSDIPIIRTKFLLNVPNYLVMGKNLEKLLTRRIQMFYKYVGAKFVPHTVFSSLQVTNCNYRLNCNLHIVFRYITTFQSPNN